MTRASLSDDDQVELQETHDLVICPEKHRNGLLAVSRNETVGHYFQGIQMPAHFQHGAALAQLVAQFSHKTLAETLSDLSETTLPNGRDTPEREALEGLLLGFPPCCVTYYVQTPVYERIQTVPQQELLYYNGAEHRIRCADCLQRDLAELQAKLQLN